MSLITAYKVKRAVATVLASGSLSSPEAKQAAQRVKQIGAPAIPALISAVEKAVDPAPLETLLLALLSNATLDDYIEALSHNDVRVVSAIGQVLARSDKIDPSRLLPCLEQDNMPRETVARALLAQAARIDYGALLAALKRVGSGARPVIFQILEQTASPARVDDLIARLDHPDPGVRARLVAIVARFPTAATRDALLRMLEDPAKAVRQAAMEGLSRLQMPVPAQRLVKYLRDPDLAVQAKTIETLVRLQDPEVVKHLVEVLQDESEYVRRAAVEVLNAVADPSSVKDLLNALRDKDWWVRVRAADALGSIGGPKVVEAVLGLIKDEDEFLRRTAVEILNTSKDEKAFEYLVEALGDEDWWVRERAADALAVLGDKRALEPLYKMLEQGGEGARVAARALVTVGGEEAGALVTDKLRDAGEHTRNNVLQALGQIADEEHAGCVQNMMTQVMNAPEFSDGVREQAREMLETVVMRFGNKTQFMAEPELPEAAEPPQDDDEWIDLGEARESGPLPSFATVDTSSLGPGQVLSNRYRVIRKVGKGGFGEVFLVHDAVVGEDLVLKFLNPHFAADENMVKRFTQELRYTRKITHKNIIRIYDFIAFGNSYAISMEYFPSHSLADELFEGQQLEVARVIAILRQICQGMSVAQAERVVHRDLKPANVLIDDGDALKVVDFGLAAAASATNSRLTKSGLLIGSPTYMAPEQVRGQSLDSRTDIYSLGVIAYEMLAGRPPYSGGEPISILFQHVEGKATPLQELRPQAPAALVDIVRKAMSIEPERRFQTFTELQSALDAVEGAG